MFQLLLFFFFWFFFCFLQINYNNDKNDKKRAVFQFYPETPKQMSLITSAAMRCGFQGGLVVDYPNSTKAKKYYLVLFAGGSGDLPAAKDGPSDNEEEEEDDDDEDNEDDDNEDGDDNEDKEMDESGEKKTMIIKKKQTINDNNFNKLETKSNASRATVFTVGRS